MGDLLNKTMNKIEAKKSFSLPPLGSQSIRHNRESGRKKEKERRILLSALSSSEHYNFIWEKINEIFLFHIRSALQYSITLSYTEKKERKKTLRARPHIFGNRWAKSK
jgi:hypothetical protein